MHICIYIEDVFNIYIYIYLFICIYIYLIYDLAAGGQAGGRTDGRPGDSFLRRRNGARGHEGTNTTTPPPIT